MRICITTGIFHPDIGGPATYLAALSDALVQWGHNPTIVTYGRSTDEHRYKVRRIRRDLPAPVRLPLFALTTLQEGLSSEVLYVNDYGLPPAIANLALRKPLVMKIVGDFAWEYALRHELVPRGLGIDEFQTRRFCAMVERLRSMQTWYTRQADLVITPSRYLASLVAGWGVSRERLRVIYNAPTPRSGRSDRDAERRKLGLSQTDFVVATLARLAPWKGVDVLIQALDAARYQFPALRLLVVGEGGERERLERQASGLDGSVRFLGEVPPEQGRALLEAADGLALCSSYEGLSHVLLEAMQSGKPIIATAVGGNLELIRDGENGLLVPYGDSVALGRALLRLATEPGLGERLSRRAREDVEASSWPKLVDATLAVFDEAIARRTARA